jgi:hypothetical protein
MKHLRPTLFSIFIGYLIYCSKGIEQTNLLVRDVRWLGINNTQALVHKLNKEGLTHSLPHQPTRGGDEEYYTEISGKCGKMSCTKEPNHCKFANLGIRREEAGRGRT